MANRSLLHKKDHAGYDQSVSVSKSKSTESARSGNHPTPGPLSPRFFLQLQRTQGNRAAEAYARSIQPGTIQRNPTPPTQTNTDPDERFETAMEAGTKASESIGDSFGMPSDDLEEAGYNSDGSVKDADLAKTSGGTGAVSGAAGAATGVFQMMSSISDSVKIYKNEDGKTTANRAWNSVEKGAQFLEGGGKAVSGGATLVDKSAKASGKLEGVGASSSVSDYAGSVADGLSAIKSAVSAVVTIYKLYDKYHEEGGLSKADVAQGAIEVLTNALESASSALKTAKTVLDIMESSTAALTSVIPGVSIAVSGMKIAFQTVDLIKAGIQRARMTKIKRDFKEKNANASFIKAKKWYNRHTGVDKAELEKHKQQLLTRKAQGDSSADAELNEIAKYELAKEMKYINVKRQDRSGLTIGLELLKIAGDVATLTGVGAQVGTPLKIAATGVSLAMPVVRSLKQSGRNRAAKADAWKLTKMVFNAEKSSEKKSEKRSKDADLILDMFANLPAFNQSDDAIVQQYKQVHDFVNAAGMSVSYLAKLQSDPVQMKDKLMEAMTKR